MKKYFTTSAFKRLNTKRSLDAVNKNRKRKKRRGIAVKGGHSNHGARGGTFKKTEFIPRITVQIKAPSDFSLIENTEETILYFNRAHNELKKGNRILFDIEHITSLTTDAIAVQIAKVKDKSFHFNSGISGNEPRDENLKKLFTQSGFYEYVNTRGSKPINSKKLLIHKLTNNRVEPDIAKEACLMGLRHTFQNEETYEPLYDILIEIMQNTNNHAGLSRGLYDWWLHVYTHPDSFRTSYTFLDLGVGIFESLPVQSFKRDLFTMIGLRSNIDLVPKLLAGEIKSRTARPERGKGIPQVFEFSQDKTFERFILISNDVYTDFKSAETRLIKNKFDGTLFYWEINKN